MNRNNVAWVLRFAAALKGPEVLHWTTAQIGLYGHRGQADLATRKGPDPILLLPLPRLVLSAAPKRKLRRKETQRSSSTSERMGLGHLERRTLHQR